MREELVLLEQVEGLPNRLEVLVEVELGEAAIADVVLVRGLLTNLEVVPHLGQIGRAIRFLKKKTYAFLVKNLVKLTEKGVKKNLQVQFSAFSLLELIKNRIIQYHYLQEKNTGNV